MLDYFELATGYCSLTISLDINTIVFNKKVMIGRHLLLTMASAWDLQ